VPHDAPLGDQRYVSLTTFTRDGRPKPTPVWIAPLGDDRIGFTTASSSWKVRRIRSTPAVTLQPCDVRGRTTAGSVATPGRAEVLTGAGFEPVRSAVAAKYGLMYRAISLQGRLARLIGKGSGTDCAIVITVAADDRSPQAD